MKASDVVCSGLILFLLGVLGGLGGERFLVFDRRAFAFIGGYPL